MKKKISDRKLLEKNMAKKLEIFLVDITVTKKIKMNLREAFELEEHDVWLK